MSLQTCTIFSPRADCTLLEPTLRQLAGNDKLRQEADQWIVRQRRIIAFQDIAFQPVLPGQQFDYMRSSLHHVFAAVPTAHEAMRAALLQCIQRFQVAVVVTCKRLVGMENLIFGVAAAMDGLVFWGGNELLDAKGKLVMSFAGKTLVAAFDGVKASAPYTPPPVSAAALARRTRSEELLKAHKMPLNPAGLALSEAETVCRSAADVADRALALLVMGLKGSRVAPAKLTQIVERLDILPLLSASELAFYQDPAPDDAACVAAAWQFEGWWAALWALGWVDRLAFPDQQCTPATMVERFRTAEGRAALFAEVRLRGEDELLDAADLSLRLHWALIDSHLRQLDPPGGIIPPLVFERQRFFYWLLHPGGWDELGAAL
jgi:Domain of unknown function (DUF4272)